MRLWRRRLNQRVRLHLSEGPTLEGRLIGARGRDLALIDVVLLLSAGKREDLAGEVIVARDRVVFGQVAGAEG